MLLKEKDILKMRQDGIFKKYHSIYDNYVLINKVRIEFEMQDIFPPMVRIMLPKSFIDLPEMIAKRKYASEYRPAIIKASPDLTVNFAFQYYSEKIREEDIIPVTRYYYTTFQKCYPGFDYLECSEHFRKSEERHVLAWYAYSNPTMTETMFNIHAFTAVEGRLLQCIFNAPQLQFNFWQPYAMEMFDSIVSGRSIQEV